MIALFKSLYLKQRFFASIFSIAVIFLFSYWIDFLYPIAWSAAILLFTVLFIDVILLFKEPLVAAERILPEKLSNSDENPVQIRVQNLGSFNIECEVIDELPVQFQKRDFLKEFKLSQGSEYTFAYEVRPVTRGAYVFGKLNIFSSTGIGLAKRRSVFKKDQEVKVYPSFLQMKNLDFLAIDTSLARSGIKKIRRIGHTMEFEQIKEYVPGDDVRSINWKATAKQAHLMTNQYQDEKAQPVYSVIDTGRVMMMPFNGLSLLDYSINSTLAFSNVVLKKKDKAGVLTFSNKVEFLAKAGSKLSHLNLILERLYKINTSYLDSDFGLLYAHIKKHITHRSLILLYTNFEHISALKRQLPYLKALAKKHVLVVIFFENTELQNLLQTSEAGNIYKNAHQTIAEQFIREKQLMVRELERNGIQAVLSKPEDLSINTINKYLEIKSRALL